MKNRFNRLRDVEIKYLQYAAHQLLAENKAIKDEISTNIRNGIIGDTNNADIPYLLNSLNCNRKKYSELSECIKIIKLEFKNNQENNKRMY